MWVESPEGDHCKACAFEGGGMCSLATNQLASGEGLPHQPVICQYWPLIYSGGNGCPQLEGEEAWGHSHI